MFEKLLDTALGIKKNGMIAPAGFSESQKPVCQFSTITVIFADCGLAGPEFNHKLNEVIFLDCELAQNPG